jgi:hypothetical protein
MIVIRASDVSEYTYCARSWWLRRAVRPTLTVQERLRRGTISHIRHGHTVRASSFLLKLAVLLFIAAGIAAYVL